MSLQKLFLIKVKKEITLTKNGLVPGILRN